MTRQDHDLSAFDQIVSLLLDQGADGLADALRLLRLLRNEAMKIERAKTLEAEPCQRAESRKGHVNDAKPKTLNTRPGRITLAVSQVRGDLDFYPSALEREARSERTFAHLLRRVEARRAADKAFAPPRWLCARTGAHRFKFQGLTRMALPDPNGITPEWHYPNGIKLGGIWDERTRPSALHSAREAGARAARPP